MSLDGIAEVLSWSPGELDSVRLSLNAQVLRVVLLLGKRVLNARGVCNRQEILDQLRQMLAPAD